MSTLLDQRRTAPPRTVARPVRVLHLVGRMTCGGVQMRTLELYRRLGADRVQFDFCALSGLPAELDDQARRLGGEVHHLAQGRPGFPSRFRRLLYKEQYDAVHGHLHYLSGYPLKLADECGVPVRVAHFRSSRPDPIADWRRRLLRMLLRPWIERYAGNATQRRWIDRHATHMLGVSRWALVCALGPRWTADPRAGVVYDGVDPAVYAGASDRSGVLREFGLPEDARLLIHVGRMTPAKNHPRIVSIFAELARREPNARLLLVGREDEAIHQRLRAQIGALGLHERIVIAGERLDVPRLMQAADALIFPSLWEGLGDVVLEATAAGAPAVCSDLPSIGEIAEHLAAVEESGLGARATLPGLSGDAGIERLSLAEPDARWADVLQATLARPNNDRARKAAGARFAASRFHVDRSAGQLERIWNSGRRGATQPGGADG